MDASNELRTRYRAMAIVAGALMGAVAVYAVLVELLATSGDTPALEDPSVLGILRPVLLGLGVALVPVIGGVRKLILVRRDGDDPEALASRMVTATVVTGALAESAAVFGLLLFILGRDRADFYVLAAWSLLLQFAWFPAVRRFEEGVKGGRPKV